MTEAHSPEPTAEGAADILLGCDYRLPVTRTNGRSPLVAHKSRVDAAQPPA
jgi:hypothetical protein